MANDIAIIGGGWAGIAAAVTLIAAGEKITLYEASRTLGGRARRISFNTPPSPPSFSKRPVSTPLESSHDIVNLDNGQHILLGAYSHVLTLFKQLHIPLHSSFLSLPLQLVYPDGWSFQAAHLPAPLHTFVGLLRAQGISYHDKWCVIKKLWQTHRQKWRLPSPISVAEWLNDQSLELHKRLWHPLCLSVMNTPIEHACAQTFLNVLRTSLIADRQNSMMLLPRQDLSTLLPDPAATYITQAKSHLQLNHRVQALYTNKDEWQLDLRSPFHTITHSPTIGANTTHRHKAVIIATDPGTANNLLRPLKHTHSALESPLKTLEQLEYEGIITLYLAYPNKRLPRAFYALTTDNDNPGQFVFDRGYLQEKHTGIMAVVISASTSLVNTMTNMQLVDTVHQQLSRTFNWNEPYTWHKLIHEKRATFRCTVDMPRIHSPLLLHHSPPLLLAGDYIGAYSAAHLEYPATIESAVRSGMAAAQCLIANLSA